VIVETCRLGEGVARLPLGRDVRRDDDHPPVVGRKCAAPQADVGAIGFFPLCGHAVAKCARRFLVSASSRDVRKCLENMLAYGIVRVHSGGAHGSAIRFVVVDEAEVLVEHDEDVVHDVERPFEGQRGRGGPGVEGARAHKVSLTFIARLCQVCTGDQTTGTPTGTSRTISHASRIPCLVTRRHPPPPRSE
jgi:hypothetical protein